MAINRWKSPADEPSACRMGMREDKSGKYFKKESWTGSFQRTLPLPASIDPEKIDAQLKDGILTLTLPKKEEAKPKQISVNVN